MTSIRLEPEYYDKLDYLVSKGFAADRSKVIRRLLDEATKPRPKPKPKKPEYKAWDILKNLK